MSIYSNKKICSFDLLLCEHNGMHVCTYACMYVYIVPYINTASHNKACMNETFNVSCRLLGQPKTSVL